MIGVLIILIIIILAFCIIKKENLSDYTYYKPRAGPPNIYNYQDQALMTLFPDDPALMRDIVRLSYPYTGLYQGVGYFAPGGGLEAGSAGSKVRVLGQRFSQPIQGYDPVYYRMSLWEQEKLNRLQNNPN